MSPCPVIYASWLGGQRYFFCEVPEIWATYALNCDVQHLSRLWYLGSLCTGHHVMWLLEWMLPCPASWGENLGLTLKCFRTDDPLYNTASSFDLPSSLSVNLVGISYLLLHSGDYLVLLSFRTLFHERQWSSWLCQNAGKSGLGKPWLGLRTKNTIL